MNDEYEIVGEEIDEINWLKLVVISILLLLFIYLFKDSGFLGYLFIPFALFIAIVVSYYMLPTDIAKKRGMGESEFLTLRIFNICLGFTLVGWYLAFQWAINYPPRQVLRKRENDNNEKD